MVQKANTLEEVMKLKWHLDEFNYYNLSVEVNGCRAKFHLHGRPNYCDRGHWQVMCESFTNREGINTIDQAEGFPRLFMSLDVAKSETLKFIAWRALKQSEGADELFSHHCDDIQRSFDK